MFRLFKNGSIDYDWERRVKKDGELKELDKSLVEQIKKKFSGKLKLYVLDGGSCSGCELELQALFTPLYDISSLGVEVVYDASKADILVVTGLVTENLYDSVKKVYKELPEPKRVITLGDCPLFQAPFVDTFALNKERLHIFSNSFSIKGCPPEPREIMRFLSKYLKKL